MLGRRLGKARLPPSSLAEVAFTFFLSQLHLKKGNFLVLKAKELGLPV